MAKKIPNQIGIKYGMLTILKDLPSKQFPKSAVRMVQARCDCDNVTEVMFGALRSGNTQSCGCMVGKAIVHGLVGTKIHTIWKTMCHKLGENNSWRDFKTFHIEMEKSYEKYAKKNGVDYTTIRRKDPDLPFSKENSVWVKYRANTRGWVPRVGHYAKAKIPKPVPIDTKGMKVIESAMIDEPTIFVPKGYKLTAI